MGKKQSTATIIQVKTTMICLLGPSGLTAEVVKVAAVRFMIAIQASAPKDKVPSLSATGSRNGFLIK